MENGFQNLILLGQQRFQEGKYAQACEILAQAVEERAASPEPRYLLAQGLIALGDWVGAEKQLSRAVRFNSRHVNARLLLASVYLELGRCKAAKDLLQGMFDFERESFELHELLIRACIGTKEHDDAERIARRWTVIAPAAAMPYVWLAKIELSRSENSVNEAAVIDHLETALSIDPKNEEAAEHLVRMTSKANGGATAINLAVGLLESNPHSARLLLAIADVLGTLGESHRAVELIEAHLQACPAPQLRKWLSSRSAQPKTKTKSPKSVVFVSDHVRSRHLKMSSALRENGWSVSLLAQQLPDYDISPYFDDIQCYNNSEHALYLAEGLSPLAFHVFSTYGDDTACRFIQDKPGAVIFEPYDLIEGFYDRPGMEAAIRKQRFCLEHADGVSSRDLRAWFARRYLDYRLPQKNISFPDYCWNYSGNDNGKLQGVHIVSNGYIGTSLSQGDADWGMLELAVSFMQMGCHFHVYPHPTQVENGEFRPELAQLVALQQQVPLFHLHKPVPANKVVEEYRQYHLGISVFGQALLDKPIQGYTPAHLRYCTASRNADYVDAGLPVLITPALESQTKMLKRHGLAIPLVKEKWAQLPGDIMALLNDGDLSGKLTKARESLAVSRHIHRLIDFYESF